MKTLRSFSLLAFSVIMLTSISAQEKGYYRFPSLYNDFVIFTAEGDLWKYNIQSNFCFRITTHHGVESNASVSPDGKWIAFNAQYEGPTEVYIIPFNGGIPKRITYEGLGGRSNPVLNGWTDDDQLIVSTSYMTTLPGKQLALVNIETLEYKMIELAQADEGSFDQGGNLYFTRLPFQGSHTKRYKGGTVQNLWKFDGSSEAVPLTADYAGTSKNPMFYNGRLYFLTDRDGTMNLWSMTPDGTDLQQHTKSIFWDLKDAELNNGKVVYQKQADLFVYDITTNKESKLDISLVSDFDQRRPYWVKDPIKKVQALDISGSGEDLVITSRGRIFSVPVDGSRWIEITRKSGIRYKSAKFAGKEDKIIFLSDESGEIELWKSDKKGFKVPEQLTNTSKVLIMNHVSSPDGKFIAYREKDYALKLCDVNTKSSKQIDLDDIGGFRNITWSPDSKWLTYVDPADNRCAQIKVMNVESNESFYVTTDRLESYNPVFSSDGKWLYFISDRTFNTSVGSPWGPRQPEPFYNKTGKIYMLALQDSLRSPFLKYDELNPKIDKKDNNDDKSNNGDKKENTEKSILQLNMTEAKNRLYEIPVPANNISSLKVTNKYLYWIQSDINDRQNRKLFAFEISNKKENKPVEVTDKVNGFDISGNGKKILVLKKDAMYVIDANGKKADLKNAKVDMKNWVFKIDPVEDWKQMLADAWRLERDYFYDKNMHGVDWREILDKHLLLVDRITDRFELDDLIASMVAELSALHTFVRPGETRKSPDNITTASLGARLIKDAQKGGYIINQIYNGEPDLPEQLSPLNQPHLTIQEGAVITKIDGVDVLEVEHINQLLNKKEGIEVRLSLTNSLGKNYEQIVKPISMSQDANLRYCEWEYSRRLEVEEKGEGKIGYFHLRAMGGNNFQEFVKGYYPVYDRDGLIIDVRHNRGGNIDSWVLSRLLRQAWFYWQSRAGKPYWNMQYAYRGHIVVLCNEGTASDGEAFAEGIKRLDLGEVIGTRTWGGEIWLTSSNRLVDNGIASASEFGVFSEDGEWLIEGHGVEPDIVVDNLPHSTFKGKDTQLEAALEFLKNKIQNEPVYVPKVPPLPIKSFDYKE